MALREPRDASQHPDTTGDYQIRHDVDVQTELLDRGDFFVCASERQRDYWMGMLSARGRVDRATYEADPTLRSLIDVLPFGCPTEPPVATEPVLRGVHPAIGTDDIVITWGGGTWEWFDRYWSSTHSRSHTNASPGCDCSSWASTRQPVMACRRCPS